MTAMVERKCACCGNPFTARAADVARGWGKFCSKSCKAIKQEARTHQNRDYHRRQERRSKFPDDISSNEMAYMVEGPEWDAHKDY